MGVLAGVDDLALAVHDTVDRDPRDDVRLDELQLVDELGRGPRELGLVIQGGEVLLLPPGVLQREGWDGGGVTKAEMHPHMDPCRNPSSVT